MRTGTKAAIFRLPNVVTRYPVVWCPHQRDWWDDTWTNRNTILGGMWTGPDL